MESLAGGEGSEPQSVQPQFTRRRSSSQQFHLVLQDSAQSCSHRCSANSHLLIGALVLRLACGSLIATTGCLCLPLLRCQTSTPSAGGHFYLCGCYSDAPGSLFFL